MWYRRAIAFVVAPLVACTAVVLVMLVLARNPYEAFFWVAPMVVASVGCSLTLGVGVHLLLRRVGWQRLRHYALAGLVIGLLPALLIGRIGHDSQWVGIAKATGIFGVILGPICGALFWYFAGLKVGGPVRSNTSLERTREG